MRGYRKLREDNTRRRRLPFKILAAAALAAGAGRLIWTHREAIGSTANSASGRLSRWADEQRDPKTYGSKTTEAPAAAGAAQAPDPQEIRTVPNASAAPAADAGPAATPAPVPDAPAEHLRTWYGVVYDLHTLHPIRSANILFYKDGLAVNSTITDQEGHYSIALARDGEDELSVTLQRPPGYREGLLEDRDPPLRERPPEDRMMILEETSDSDLEPVPLRCSPNAEVVQLDLVLVPVMKR